GGQPRSLAQRRPIRQLDLRRHLCPRLGPQGRRDRQAAGVYAVGGITSPERQRWDTRILRKSKSFRGMLVSRRLRSGLVGKISAPSPTPATSPPRRTPPAVGQYAAHWHAVAPAVPGLSTARSPCNPASRCCWP